MLDASHRDLERKLQQQQENRTLLLHELRKLPRLLVLLGHNYPQRVS